MIQNPKTLSITFSKSELTKLWKLIVISYEKYIGEKTPINTVTESGKPPSIWEKIFEHFKNKTCFKNSSISLGQEGKTNEEREFKQDYFSKRLIGKHEKKLGINYLRQIVFYLSGQSQLDVVEYLKSKGFKFDDEMETDLPTGLEYLEGTWIGINRNLEKHKYAICYYQFKAEGAKMMVNREAYSSEIMYEGEAFLQEDSSFMMHLKGRSRGRIKFIMANPKKVQPDMLKCYASAYSTISPQEPAIVKELVIKIDKDVVLKKGDVVSKGELEHTINKTFEAYYAKLVLEQLHNFLGDQEEHVFTLNELSQIKQIDLKPIRKRLNNEKLIENLTANFRVNHLGTSSKYIRSIVKYRKDNTTQQMIPVTFNTEVKDEYVLTQIDKYSRDTIQLHPVEHKADTANGAVDILPLFPFVEEVLGNEKEEPEARSSSLLVDAHGDTFVSSTTIINEFGRTKKLTLDIAETTLQTEIVVDFGALADFEKFDIKLSQLAYYYNQPDEKGGESAMVTNFNENMRTFNLQSIDRKGRKIEHDEGFRFDPNNTKLYVIIIGFTMYKGDCFSIDFEFNNN